MRTLASVILGLGLLAACAESGGSTGRDSGTFPPDRPSPSLCGDVGEICCTEAPLCTTGTVCDPEGTCCAVPRGARCTGPSDCCGDLDCVGGGCCGPVGSACRSVSDCCAGLLCGLDGTCGVGEAGCGAEREACCDGDMCEAGLTCNGDICLPCGGAGQACCRSTPQCQDGAVCMDGRCETAGECGREGQPCCDGDACGGTLTCTGGMCAAASDPCGATSCGTCTGRLGCGWCEGSSACMAGTATGPSAGSCASGWTTVATSCSPSTDTCGTNTECGGCTTAPPYNCGWCANTGTCKQGTSSGPSDASCSGDDWAWLSSECTSTPPPDTCGSNTDCASCTLDTSYVCGWCPGTNSCHRGTSTGATDGSCADPAWRWLSSECGGGTPMCSNLAGTCAVDADCCGDLSCRRGVTFSRRCCTEAMGACSTGADCCGYMDCVSGRCTCRGATRACLDNRDCCSGVCSSGRCT